MVVIQFIYDKERDMFVESWDGEPVRAYTPEGFVKYLDLVYSIYMKVEMEKILPALEGIIVEQKFRTIIKEMDR